MNSTTPLRQKVRPKWTPLRVLMWVAIVAIGVVSLWAVAFSRHENINALWLIVASVCVFAVSYRFHSAWLMAKVLTIDEMRAVPSITKADGRDFVKTNRWVVFSHHFAAIAGPGPLVGPVLASQFGYLPGTLWILIGATLGGAVHDSIVLFASTRRSGRSVGQIMRDEVGPFAGALSMISILAILVIIIAVLALVVVKALAHSPWGTFTIGFTIPLALVMGVMMKSGKVHMGVITLIGIIGLLFAVVGGNFLHSYPAFEQWLTLRGESLAWIIMIYGLISSSLPVWLLLAPRDYLSSFMKIGVIAFLAVAIVILAPPIKMPALTAFIEGGGPVLRGAVFPFCFITIACAAISGFHSIIASGTTPKIIPNEKDIRVVGYGGMITEMLVGIVALISACTMNPGEYFAINLSDTGTTEEVTAKVTAKVSALDNSNPIYKVTVEDMNNLAEAVGEKTMVGRTGGAPTFAVGMAHMFAGLFGKTMTKLWYHFAIMFEALFILTTIDAGTRVGRFLVKDFIGIFAKPLGKSDSRLGNFLGSLGFIGMWGYFLYQGVTDPHGGINSLWPIFGVSNQLLAVIGFALGTTVLIKMGKLRYAWVTVIPLLWLISVTFTAGYQLIFSRQVWTTYGNAPEGFFFKARYFGDLISKGITEVPFADTTVAAKTLMVNNYINAGVTGIFLILVTLILFTCIKLWAQLISGKRKPVLHESEYVRLDQVPNA